MYTNLSFVRDCYAVKGASGANLGVVCCPVCGQVKPLFECRKFDLMCQDCSNGIDKYLETEEFMEKLVPVLPLEDDMYEPFDNGHIPF